MNNIVVYFVSNPVISEKLMAKCSAPMKLDPQLEKISEQNPL